MAKSQLNIKHSMSEVEFRHAHRMAESLTFEFKEDASASFTLEIRMPTNLTECDELITYLSFAPSLGTAVANALEGSNSKISLLSLQVSMDETVQPQNVFPVEVGERLYQILQS